MNLKWERSDERGIAKGESILEKKEFDRYTSRIKTFIYCISDRQNKNKTRIRHVCKISSRRK